MAGKNRAGKAWKEAYGAYKTGGKYEKNRRRRLNKHIAANPEDKVAAAATNKIEYRRGKPKSPLGWTYSAFKNVDKKFRSENMVTKEQCQFWAYALKIQKKVANEMMHLPKDVRERMRQENKSNKKGG